MASDPRIRASDADRDRVATALREHHAAGRLTMDEFQDRLDRTYAAKTLGDLDELMSDLPAIDLYQLPIPASQPPPPPARPQVGRLSPVWRAAWASWLSVSVLCIVIWLLSDPGGYFWPAWVAFPWGAAMAARWLLGAAPHDRGQRRDDPRSLRHDRRAELRANRAQFRRDYRTPRGGQQDGPPTGPPGKPNGE